MRRGNEKQEPSGSRQEILNFERGRFAVVELEDVSVAVIRDKDVARSLVNVKNVLRADGDGHV